MTMMHARTTAALLAILIITGCSATQTATDDGVQMVAGDITEEIATNTALCNAACEHEATCMGDDEAMLAACRDECAQVWTSRESPNAPSTRVCLWQERRELECFAATSCEALQVYFDPLQTEGWACAAEDAAAVEACAPLR